MASTIVITIQSNLSQTEAKLHTQKGVDRPRESIRAIKSQIHRVEGGITRAIVDVATSAVAPVRATGTLTLTFASMANNDTVGIGKTTLTCVTGTPTAGQFKKVTDGPTTATNLAAAINASATLSKLGVATAASSVVTFRLFAPGTVGNEIPLATSNSGGVAVSASYMAGGTGGSEEAAQTYHVGL